MYTRGITFIETLVWIAVFTLAMGAIVISLLSFYGANTYTLEQAQAVSDARRGIERSIQILREASFASDGAYPVAGMSENELTFYSDIDDDPLIERVRLFLNGTSFQQGVIEATGNPPAYGSSEIVSTISENIRNIEQAVTTFHYFDETGAEITDFADVTDVRFITVDLIVNVSPNRLPNELTLRSSATLRNLRN